jgi:hypothetical protein
MTGANQMSTRGTVFYHVDQATGVTIHIYDELVEVDTPRGLRLEIEHSCGVTNVAWPVDEAKTKMLEDSRS